MIKQLQKIVALLVIACAFTLLCACGAKQATSSEPKVFDKQALSDTLAAQTFFNDAKEPTAAELTDLYAIDTSLFAESILLVDKDYNLCMMMIPAEGKSNHVKNMMAKSLDNLAQQLEMYQPQQCQQVRERMETMRGDYLIYLATPDNDTALAAITEAIEG